MPSKKKSQWKTLVLGCFKDKNLTLESPKLVSKKQGSSRISLSDLSDYSSPSVISDLSNSLVGNVQIFTCKELKEITNNFNKSNFLGEGGFGKVYKGFIDDKLRPALVPPQLVAVKALNLDGKQGHREWLVRTFLNLSTLLSLSVFYKPNQTVQPIKQAIKPQNDVKILIFFNVL